MERRLYSCDTYIESGEEFHFAYKRLDSHRPRFLHFHDFHEVFIVERGRARHFVNGGIELLESGAVVFMRPDDIHALQSVGDPLCRIINVLCRNETVDHFAARYGKEFRDRFFWTGSELPDRYDLGGQHMERLVNLALELRASSRTLARLESFLLTVMTRVIDDSASVPEAAPVWLNAACMAAQSREVFSRGARGFVEASGRGHEHVCRETKRHLGVSPSVLINRIRMVHAARLLREGEYSVEDISHSCGIRNLSHFHRLFREHHCTTPGRYRKRHLANPVQPA